MFWVCAALAVVSLAGCGYNIALRDWDGFIATGLTFISLSCSATVFLLRSRQEKPLTEEEESK